MTATKTTQAGLARKLKTTNQLIYYYFTSPGSAYKAQRIAKALSTKDAKFDWKDLII